MLRNRNPYKKLKENENIKKLDKLLIELHNYIDEISDGGFLDIYSSILRNQEIKLKK